MAEVTRGQSAIIEHTASALTKDQKRRVEALTTARATLQRNGLTNGPVVTADEVIKVADYILHGKVTR